jgi:hypothetical protein
MNTLPYTYLIGWSQYDTWYYGVRYSATASSNDLWQSYFTSSDYVNNFRELYGEPDVVSVRRTFDSKEKAISWEHKVLRRMGVKLSDRWLNKNDLCAPPVMQGIDHPFYGKTHSEETKLKMSESLKGKTRTKEHQRKLTESLRGKTLSEETKRKISEAKKGKTRTEEHQRKLSESLKGRTHSEETKRKITESLRGKTLSEETRRKISESKRRYFIQKKLLSSKISTNSTTPRLIFS